MKKAWKALDTLKDVDTGVSGSDALNIIEQSLTELEELLALYKELGGIEQDIEYLCGLRDCMIEHSVEKPMEHIYSGIKEYKEKRDGLNYQSKQLEKELEEMK